MSAPTEAQLRRGLLLLALHDQYPHPLMEAALVRATAALYAAEPKDRARDLAYLAEQGLLTADESTLANRVLRTFRLTAAGLDVVDGATVDPGVALIRSER